MNQELLALTAWRQQALSRGIPAEELPAPHQLGYFLHKRDNPAELEKQPVIVPWVGSLKKLMVAVDTGNFDQNTPLPDLFFKKSSNLDKVKSESKKAFDNFTAAASKTKESATSFIEAKMDPLRFEVEKAKKAAEEMLKQEPAQGTPQNNPLSTPQQPKKTPQTQPVKTAVALTSLTGSDFAENDPFDAPVEAEGAQLNVTYQVPDDEAATPVYTVTWDCVKNKNMVQIFRVVSVDRQLEEDDIFPTTGSVRLITEGKAFVDDSKVSTAIRTYHVWMNEGKTTEEALASQAKLVGTKAFVQPIRNFELAEVGSSIRGSWEHLDGTTRVEILRLDDREGDIAVSGDRNNERGFEFTPQFTGCEYKFKVRRWVGNEASAFSGVRRIWIAAELSMVELKVERHRQDFHLSWAKPGAGQVTVYCSPEPPRVGVNEKKVDRGRLAQFGFQEIHAVNTLDASQYQMNWQWPEDWYSVYMTPVNIIGDEALVGQTHSWVRCGKIENIRLYERVDEQRFTFAWPHEATGMQIFTAPYEDASEVPVNENGEWEIDKDQMQELVSTTRKLYDRDGGVVRALDGPCTLVFMPYRSHRSQMIYGEPALFKYRGVQKISYKFGWGSGTDKLTGLRQLQLAIFSTDPYLYCNSFVLRAELGRLPLEASSPSTADSFDVSVKSSNGGDNYSRVIRSNNHFVGTPSPESNGEFFNINMSELVGKRNICLRLFPSEADFIDENHGEDPIPVIIDPPVEELINVDNAFNQQSIQLQQPAQSQRSQEPQQKKGLLGRLFRS